MINSTIWRRLNLIFALAFCLVGCADSDRSTSKLPANGTVLLISCLGCSSCTNELSFVSVALLKSNDSFYVARHVACEGYPLLVEYGNHERVVILHDYSLFEELGITTGNALVEMREGQVKSLLVISPNNLDSVLTLFTATR